MEKIWIGIVVIVVAAILLAIVSFRTANGETKFVFENWFEILLGLWVVAQRYVMFFTNSKERQQKA